VTAVAPSGASGSVSAAVEKAMPADGVVERGDSQAAFPSPRQKARGGVDVRRERNVAAHGPGERADDALGAVDATAVVVPGEGDRAGRRVGVAAERGGPGGEHTGFKQHVVAGLGGAPRAELLGGCLRPLAAVSGSAVGQGEGDLGVRVGGDVQALLFGLPFDDVEELGAVGVLGRDASVVAGGEFGEEDVQALPVGDQGRGVDDQFGRRVDHPQQRAGARFAGGEHVHGDVVPDHLHGQAGAGQVADPQPQCLVPRDDGRDGGPQALGVQGVRDRHTRGDTLLGGVGPEAPLLRGEPVAVDRGHWKSRFT
jgi:hypothetical protein